MIQSVYDAPILHPWLRRVNALPIAAKRFLFQVINREADLVFGPAINDLRAQQGLPTVQGITSHWWHSPRRVIGLFPEWFAAPQPDWPLHTTLTGFPLFDADTGVGLSPELETFLDGGDTTRRVSPGLRLPRAAALVHHGGIGTAAQGLAAGLPQLVMPMTFDQPDNANRLERLGVAASLRPRGFTGPAVAAALRRILDSDTVAARCATFASKLDPSAAVTQTCEEIERSVG